MYDVLSFVAELTRLNQPAATVVGGDETLVGLTESVTLMLGVAGSAVCLVADGQVRYAAASREAAAALARCQERFHAGPAFDALRTSRIQAVADVRRYEVRWPSYTAAARRVGVAGVAAIPMRVGGEPMGVLSLHTDEPHDWNSDELDAAQVLAELAATNVVNARALMEQRRLTDQLQHALDARVVIEQAKGVLANRHAISMEQAFELIRRYARSRHVTARDVARDVVDLRLRL